MTEPGLFEELTYEEALKQLREIVSDVEEGKVDIDHLEETIEKANQLVALCQFRLKNITEKLEAQTRKEED